MDPSIRPSSQPEILEAHAEHVRETLKLAASLGRVAIVTLAASLGGDVDEWHGMDSRSVMRPGFWKSQ